MRLFVAVRPSEPALADLSDAVASLAVARPREPGAGAGLAPPDRWHITLAFLGEVPDGRVDDARTALTRVVDQGHGPVRLRIAGGGCFGRGRFTVLWAGLRGDLDELRRLAGGVRDELRRARVRPDGKPFRPHLTLARPRGRMTAAEVAADVDRLSRYEGPWWQVESVDLMRSHLGPQPSHETLFDAALT